jgi:hypothetical protein
MFLHFVACINFVGENIITIKNNAEILREGCTNIGLQINVNIINLLICRVINLSNLASIQEKIIHRLGLSNTGFKYLRIWRCACLLCNVNLRLYYCITVN